jgi:hypothetical protein
VSEVSIDTGVSDVTTGNRTPFDCLGCPPLILVHFVSAMGFYSKHKSSSTGSIPVSPNRHGIKQEIKSSHPSFRTCKLMHMTGSKKYSPVGTKTQSRVGLDL